jgi:Mrp family chromosome partitioning ATPase
MVTDEQILEALRGVIHPEMKRNLVDLGMIKNVAVDDGVLTFTLLLPFMEIPIRDDLVREVKDAVKALDDNIEARVHLVEMSQQERAAFMAQAEGGPKQAQSMNKIGRVIAVLSGKGGVGKSSVAALLAVALSRQGKRVGVLDADITGPSQPKMFGLREPPAMGPIGILPPATETGIKVMSINLLLPSEDEAVIWRGPLISGAIKQFWQDVLWGQLDYLIVDLPPGTSDASLTVMQSIPLDGVVLVTSPQDLAGMVVRKSARMTQRMGASVLGVVENMSYAICPKCGEKIEVFGPSQAMKMAARLGVTFLGRLPLDSELSLRCDAGEIESYAAEAFAPIAGQVMEQVLAREAMAVSSGE